MPIRRDFKLYLNAGRSIPLVINASQYDRGEKWYFLLYSETGEQYYPDSAAIVGTKADGNLIANAAETDGRGYVIVTETEQMTAAAGKNKFELLIDDQTHGTANFVLLVEPSPADEGVPSESDLSLIQQAIDGTSATAIAQGVSDWMDENLTPTTPVVDTSLTVSGAAADSAKVGQEISDLKSQITQSAGLTSEIKQALMDLANAVAFKGNDPTGQTYIDALEDALYPPVVYTAITLDKNSLSFGSLNSTQQLTATTTPIGGYVAWSSSNTSVATVSQTGVVTSVGYGNATITATCGSLTAQCSVAVAQATVTSISAVYTQSGTVYDDASLDSLKSDLIVTAHWSNDTTSTVPNADYTLSGTLTVGTSTITVSYGGKTATFSVTVSDFPYPYNLNYAFSDIELTDGYINDSGVITTLEGNKLLNELVPAVGFCLVTSSGGVYTTGSNKSLRLAEYDSAEAFIARSYATSENKIIGSNNPSFIKMGFSDNETVLSGGVDRFVALNPLDTTLCTIPNMNVDADGNEVAMADASLSDYLPINSDGYIVAYVQNNHDTEVIAFFDENRNIISRHPVVSSGAGRPLITAFAVPSNAKYVRFRCTTTPNATEYISYVR